MEHNCATLGCMRMAPDDGPLCARCEAIIAREERLRERYERRMTCLDMRRKGSSFVEIGQRLGITQQAASEMHKHALADAKWEGI